MKVSIQAAAQPDKTASIIILADKKTNWTKAGLSKTETDMVLAQRKAEVTQVALTHRLPYKFVCFPFDNGNGKNAAESARKAGAALCGVLNKYKIASVFLRNASMESHASLHFAEGLALSNYQFLSHVTSKKGENKLNRIRLGLYEVSKQHVDELNTLVEASTMVRDLVNEPVNFLNATQLAQAFEQAGMIAGFKTQILDKKKIEALKMGGLLSVNQGSVDPPTFTIMEYKPENAFNKKPYVLVGKGVVYDTGGLSLKPTTNSMDSMKSDMAGAATVAGILYSVAKNKLPIHVIGLTPSTDNRPGFNAFAPGDIITMYNGATVEMLNSDAEGRMILADALHYAKQFNPELVIDMATLTGAAHRALGDYAIAYMGTAGEDLKKEFEQTGMETYERLVHFPLWDEYGDQLKSDIADFKNVGGMLAGHITAGKFLEKFTDYPWLHLDIAGVAYLSSSQGYKVKNATAVGLRLVYNFLKKQIK